MIILVAKIALGPSFPRGGLRTKNAQFFTIGQETFRGRAGKYRSLLHSTVLNSFDIFSCHSKERLPAPLTSKIGSRQMGQSSTFSRIDGFSC